MRFIKSLVFVLLWVSLVSAQKIPGTDFPYARFQLRTPALESPYPWFSNGIETALWNPASLARIKGAQSSLALVSELAPFEYNYKYSTEDQLNKLGGLDYMRLGIFITGDRTVTSAATREHTAHTIYSTKAAGLTFKQALKANDWLSFGFISRGDVGASIDMSGNFPLTTKFMANMSNTSFNLGSSLSVAIDAGGIPTLTITPEGGATYTQQLDTQLWSGFLNQSSTVPYTTLLEARNDVSVSAPLTMVGAAKFKDFSFGLNLTPISASSNIDNTARAVIDSGTPDMVLYQPNLNPNDEQSILNWSQDPNQYGTELGYKKNTVLVPAGEVIAEARYKGFYQASTARLDLGASYDLGEAVTVGLVLENLSGATLDFRGTGRVAYANSRIGTLEAPSLDPTEEFTWSPFKNTFEPVEGSEKYSLEEQLPAQLPRKVRFSVVLRRPLLIALDYEQNQTPIKFKYEDKTTGQTALGQISNINLLRLGGESQLLALPFWLRGSLILMFKPTLSNVEPNVQDQTDKVFKYGVLPLGLELGSELNLWGVVVGDSFGINLTPLFSLAQLDTVNLDTNKLSYYDVSLRYGYWQLSYLAALDPGATAGAYANRADKTQGMTRAGPDLSSFLPYLRYIHTLKVSYKF